LIINKDEILFVILAGGQSKRFGGGFKTFAKFNNQSILDRIITQLKTAKVDMIINANFNQNKLLKNNITIVPDIDNKFNGPLAGIYASMVWSKKNHLRKKWIFTIPSDTPFLPNNLIKKFLCNFDKSKKIFIARSAKKPQPVVGMWDISLVDNLKNFLNGYNKKIMDCVKKHDYKFVDFENNDFDYFFNINTLQDLKQASVMEREISNK
tara:strand:+ start:8699 stop:9325 length:627 start_codon:yes stop_codon:yes gene_type:complete